MSVHGEAGSNGKKLTFKGSVFHRVIPVLFARAAISRWTAERVVDGEARDNFALKHVGAGSSMANRGRDTNASQFFINLDVRLVDGKPWALGPRTLLAPRRGAVRAAGPRVGQDAGAVRDYDCGERRRRRDFPLKF